MSEPTCQWCGAGVNHTFENNSGEPVLYLFCCQTSRWHDGPWHIGNQCKERCAEQMRRLREMNDRAVQATVAAVTKGD